MSYSICRFIIGFTFSTIIYAAVLLIAYQETGRAHDCPYGCDPIKAFGGPNLGRPYSTLAGLMMFVAGMYFSDRGLERRPFAFQHISGWLVAVFGGCFLLLGTLPYVLTIVWEML